MSAQEAHHVEHFERQEEGSWRLAEVYAKVTLEPVVPLVLDGPR